MACEPLPLLLNQSVQRSAGYHSMDQPCVFVLEIQARTFVFICLFRTLILEIYCHVRALSRALRGQFLAQYSESMVLQLLKRWEISGRILKPVHYDSE